jgi:hypothetical protein
MGPLSAVAISFFLAIYGLTEITWITASNKALGVIAIIATVVILLDAFWIGSGRRWAAWRGEG